MQEVCDEDNADEDCDGSSDNGDSSALGSTMTRFYQDQDNDGFGDADDAGALSCDPTVTHPVSDSSDCDDSRGDVHPEGQEVCDEDDADEDCSGAPLQSSSASSSSQTSCPSG